MPWKRTVLDLVFQPTSPAQATQLAALHAASFGSTAWTLQQIQDSLKLETTHGFTANLNNEIVGFILFQQTDDQAEILTFCVHPKRQRQKIGEALLQKTIEASNTPLFLEVAADNAAACNLYAKLGFQIIGKRPHYYNRGANPPIDALTFKRAPFASVT